jgi:hypothetical protein
MAKLKTVMPGVVLRYGARGKTMRFSCMIGRSRFTYTVKTPVELLLNKNDTPTRELQSEYNRWVAQQAASVGQAGIAGLRVPSIKELIDTFSDIAWTRQTDPRFKKADRTIETAIKNFGYCLDASGIRDTRPYIELMDFDVIRRIAKKFVDPVAEGGRGLTSTSAWSYISALQSVTAKWTIAEYRDRGYIVESQVIPKSSLFGKAADPKQYTELSPSVIAKIWDWYMKMQDGDASCAFYAICMLELAIRPGDIGRLTADNFPMATNGHHRLVYKPRKTRESSNRRVDIEIPDALYERLKALKPAEFGKAAKPGEPGHQEEFEPGMVFIPNLRTVEDKVNASLRDSCGLDREHYGKASYELRKLCIHTILVTPADQGGGVDQAVRLSGDRRDTIEKYYCDPYKSHTALPSNAFAAFAKSVTGLAEHSSAVKSVST